MTALSTILVRTVKEGCLWCMAGASSLPDPVLEGRCFCAFVVSFCSICSSVVPMYIYIFRIFGSCVLCHCVHGILHSVLSS
jgi:hypothetical protein